MRKEDKEEGRGRDEDEKSKGTSKKKTVLWMMDGTVTQSTVAGEAVSWGSWMPSNVVMGMTDERGDEDVW
jgi:hypothetical protein